MSTERRSGMYDARTYRTCRDPVGAQYQSRLVSSAFQLQQHRRVTRAHQQKQPQRQQ